MIDTWLVDFVSYWKAKDLRGIRSLFADNVEYWETPFRRLATTDDVMQEWAGILNQENIAINTEVVMQDGSKSVIRWMLSYDRNGSHFEWVGFYIVTLQNDGRCSHFYQVGQSR